MSETDCKFTQHFAGVLPEKISSLNDELLSCIKQVSQLRNSVNKILYLTVFVDCKTTVSFKNFKKDLYHQLSGYQLNNLPVSVVAQKPKNKSVCIEVSYTNDPRIKIIDKIINLISYREIVFPTHSLILGMGLKGSLKEDIKSQSISAFNQLEAILSAENMSFNRIIRQWNYIENITCNSLIDGVSQQHYQIFNDVRSDYYNKSEFKNGYPAATGIGTYCGGVSIDFIALKQSESTSEVFLTNPKQTDAHKYSKEVLVGHFNTIKTTPKFERAKAIVNPDKIDLYVSGTAAIRGENSVHSKSVEEQTKETIKIIESLVDKSNLIKHGISKTGELTCKLIRAYVRQDENPFIVESVLRKEFSSVTIIVLSGNVCRDNLLVEIEAYFSS